MNKIWFQTGVLACALLAPRLSAEDTPKYKDPHQPVDARVADLLGRMNLEEKVAELRSIYGSASKVHDLVKSPAAMEGVFKHGLGMINPDFEVGVEQTVEWRNGVQEYLRTKTRLGIPTIFIDEAHHGLLQDDVDVFPHGIALASTWDPALLEKVYTYVANQARARGTHLVLSPVIDVTRDPRWGRTGETHGEDPYLCGILGAAVVRGFQGSADGTIAPGHVAATLKHFTGHGESVAGINQGPANYSERTLREMHMEPFRLCIERANPASIMASYCDLDGVPSHANRWLLTDVLRNEWKWEGIVVSDWFAIDQLWNKHFVEPNQKDAARRAFEAGVTVDLPFGVNYAHLVSLVKEGKVKESDLDVAVKRVLTLKFKLGLFEEKPVELAEARAQSARDEGRALAREAAERGMILLKNENQILPLNPTKLRSIALVGPCAATNYLGDYSGKPLRNVSLLDGLRAKLGDRCELLYAEGCKLAKDADPIRVSNYQNAGRLELPAIEDNQALIARALKVVERADVIVCAVGESEQFSQEAGARAPGDMSSLDLQSNQLDLVKAMVATGKPVIVYLMHARPFCIPWIAENATAIVDGWYSGEETGNAFANLLVGDVNFSGKLTITYPRSIGQLPIYYNHKPSGRSFDYVTEPGRPLFPFGYGLSYTTYKYSNLRLSASDMSRDGVITASIDLENTGTRAGEEIVQLYLRQAVSSATRPVKELKDFTRVHLKPGEKTTVKFKIDQTKLAYWNAALRYGVEPGAFLVMVGPSSVSYEAATFEVKAN